jgi:O-antigen ligase
LGTPFHEGLELFYGRGALEQSPWELSGRVELWNAAAATFERAIFLGFGLDGARDQLLRAMPWAGEAHNAFLELLLAAGGSGLLCFLAGWMSAIRPTLNSQSRRSALPIHCFLLAVATTGPSLMLSQYLGVFLIICLRYWVHKLSLDENEQLDIQRFPMQVMPDGARETR